jgi:hypothetical protein
MDLKKYKRNFTWAVLGSPLTLGPMATGVILMAGAVIVTSPVLGILGGAAAAAGGWIFVSRRWINPSTKLSEAAMEKVKEEERIERNQELDELYRCLLKLKEIKAADLLKELRTLYKEFFESEEWKKGANNYSIDQARQNIEELYSYCFKSLKRICEFKTLANNTNIKELKTKYQRKIGEIVNSIEQSRDIIQKTLTGFHEIAMSSTDLSGSTEDVSGIGRELERHLRIAAEISQKYSRPDSIDREAEKPKE